METVPAVKKRGETMAYLKRYWTLYLLLILPVIYFIIFRYVPMAYLLIAFKKYSIVQQLWQMPWAANHGFQYFLQAFKNRDFFTSVGVTLLLNFLDIAVGFPMPVILALILNELTFRKFKRVTQTIIYMPHFLSWVIIAGLALQLFAPTNGLVNIMLGKIGVGPIPFLNDPAHWIWTYVFVGMWQSMGWGTIIYLAAITGVNPELYEAASVDGAGRLRKMWHITLPGLRPTIVTLLILQLGRILGSDFDRPYAMTNKLVAGVSNVLSVFIYTNGIKGLQFSLTTAVGLFQSVICVIFLFAANALAKKFGERGVW